MKWLRSSRSGTEPGTQGSPRRQPLETANEAENPLAECLPRQSRSGSGSLRKGLLWGTSIALVLLFWQEIPADEVSSGTPKVRFGEFIKELPFTGELLTVDAFVATVPRKWLPAEVPISYLAPEGSVVKAGDVLVQFDETNLTQLQLEYETNVEEARTAAARKEAELETEKLGLMLDLASAERNLKHAQLYASIDTSLLSRQEAQEYKFNLEKASIEIDKVRRRLASQESSGKTQMELAHLDLERARLRFKKLLAEKEKLTIRAQTPGVVIYAENPVSDSKVQVGDILWQGMPVVFVPDPSAFRVRTFVYDADFPFLSEGLEATVTLDAYPGRSFSGRVGALPQIAQKREYRDDLKAFQVDVMLSEIEPEMMKPGMSARVTIEIRRKDVFSVPRNALARLPDGPAVIPLDNPDEPVRVQVVDANRNWVEVRGDLIANQELLLPESSGAGQEERETSWIQIRRQDLLFSISGTGTLEAENSYSVGPPALAKHWEFKITDMVPEGSTVEKGDMLITFDTKDAIDRLQEERAELEKVQRENSKIRATLQLSIQDINLDLEEARVAREKARARLAQARQFESILKVRSAELDAELAEQRVELLQKQLASVRRNVDLQLKILSDLETLRTNRIVWFRNAIDALTVTAPASGVVLYKANARNETKQIGSAVYPKEVVLTLPDLSSLVVSGRIAEMDAGQLRIGQEVLVTLEPLPNQKFTGHVKEIGRIFTPASFASPVRVVDVTISLDQIDLSIMRPGMAARLQIILNRFEQALSVPLPSIGKEGDDSFVWVKGPEGPRRRRVELGETNGLVALIRSGLEADQEIAARPLSQNR